MYEYETSKLLKIYAKIRSMRTKRVDIEIIDSIIYLIKTINDEHLNGSLIVVEGKRDREALIQLGYIGEIFTLCHNQSLSTLMITAESYRKVILMLDLDHEGRTMTKKVVSNLAKKNISTDLFYRKRLSTATKGEVKCIQELLRYSELIDDSVISR